MAKDITPQVEIISMRDRIIRTVDIFGRPFGEVFNGLRGSTTAFQRGVGDARVKSIGLGGQFFSLSPGEDIQTAIDTLFNLGGGELFFEGGGVHNAVSGTDIILKSNILYSGAGPGKTIINMQGQSFVGHGPAAYTTGTASFTQNSKIITGSSTVWLTNAEVGELIINTNEGNSREYEISEIISDTELRITQDYAEADDSGAAYLIDRNKHDIEFRDFSLNNCSTGFDFSRARDFLVSNVHARKGTGRGFLASTCKRYSVSFCRFEGFAGKGIFFQAGSNEEKRYCENNVVRLCGDDGIDVSVRNTVFRGNVIIDNGGAGLHVTSLGDFNMISENVTNGNPDGGVLLDIGATSNIVANNQLSDGYIDNGTTNINDNNRV